MVVQRARRPVHGDGEHHVEGQPAHGVYEKHHPEHAHGARLLEAVLERTGVDLLETTLRYPGDVQLLHRILAPRLVLGWHLRRLSGLVSVR